MLFKVQNNLQVVSDLTCILLDEVYTQHLLM